MNAHNPFGRSHKAPSVPTAAVPAHPLTGTAVSSSKMPCLECQGAGEAEYMALDAIRPHWADCHVCDGTGVVAPYCETCEQKLTVDGFCVSCDDYASLVYVERIAPGRVAL